MKKKRFLALFIMLLCTYIVSGQVVPPPVPPPPPPGLPIDTGLFFLVVSGIIYGIKKLKFS
jgi:hypothetical protein